MRRCAGCLKQRRDRLHRQLGDCVRRYDLARQRDDLGRASSAPTRAPARPCAFDRVRRIARLGRCRQSAAQAGHSGEFDVSLIHDQQCAWAPGDAQRSTQHARRAPHWPWVVRRTDEHQFRVLIDALPAMPSTSSAKPSLASSGTGTTAAPWMRAATPNMPKVGGQTMTLSVPARQNTRTSRSMASSLPRPTSTCAGDHAIQSRKALHQLRAAAARDND